MTQTLPPKRIPYGVADYGRLRRENAYYVDKTRFIPLIEAAPFYLFCIRPRRFGKTLWLSVLQHYYDVNKAEQFDELFGDTYIGQQPTVERNSYLILFLNFATVNPTLTEVQTSFEATINNEIDGFLRRYQRFFTEDEIHYVSAGETVASRLQRIFYYVTEKQLKLYLLIDEYDNFTNTILTTEGQAAYHELTHGAGFFRYFFNLLKGATAGQTAGLTRLFITGVSPVTMDDVTSGFNIGRNISMHEQFNEMIGFTETETLALLQYYQAADQLKLPIDATLALMQEWYNGYRFGQEATATLYNSDMVLYFLDEAKQRTTLPLVLIDQNVRTDYGKLRHLMAVDRRLNGNFRQLQSIVESGEIIASLKQSFPAEQLTDSSNFISLLYYLGFLSIVGCIEGQSCLSIPNRTIKEVLFEHNDIVPIEPT